MSCSLGDKDLGSKLREAFFFNRESSHQSFQFYADEVFKLCRPNYAVLVEANKDTICVVLFGFSPLAERGNQGFLAVIHSNAS